MASALYRSLLPESEGLLTYQGSPVNFVHDCIEFDDGEQPTPYQDEVLTVFPEKKRCAVRGPHGLGKTALASWLVWWGILSFDDVKVLTTASAWRQLTKFLWPEIHKWGKRIRWDRVGIPPMTTDQMLTLSLKRSVSAEAFAVASSNPELIEGAHAKTVLYIYDEAKAIPNPTWDATEGAFSTAGIDERHQAYALAISTPGDAAGRFFEICANRPGYEDWWSRHVTVNEAIDAKRISRDWVEQRRKQWGEDSPIFQARVLGEFPDTTDDTLIPLTWVDKARENEMALDDRIMPIAGVDVARFGSDDSALIARQGDSVIDGETWSGNDTMKTAGKVKNKGYRSQVDEIGVGSGVVDRLKEQQYPVKGINVSNSPRDKEHFFQLRDELYWLLRIRFRDGNIDLSRLPRPIYDRLSGELTAIKYSYLSSGKIKVESKQDMKKRLGHSPDVADALMLAFAPPPPKAKVRRLG